MVITHLRRIEHRPGDAAARVVDIDDALMHAQTIAETHGADLAVDRRIDDETRHQAGVQRADVAHRVPDIRRARVDHDVSMDRCHVQASGFRQRSEEHTSELKSLMRISYAVFCLKKKKYKTK